MKSFLRRQLESQGPGCGPVRTMPFSRRRRLFSFPCAFLRDNRRDNNIRFCGSGAKPLRYSSRWVTAAKCGSRYFQNINEETFHKFCFFLQFRAVVPLRILISFTFNHFSSSFSALSPVGRIFSGYVRVPRSSHRPLGRPSLKSVPPQNPPQIGTHRKTTPGKRRFSLLLSLFFRPSQSVFFQKRLGASNPMKFPNPLAVHSALKKWPPTQKTAKKVA